MNKFNSRIPRYNDDSDYTTNAPSYYDDLARKNKLIKELAKKIWEYEKTLNESLEDIEQKLNEYITIVDGKLELIDHIIGEGFNDRIEELLREWVNDGTLEHIINVEIFNKKADKKDLTWVSYDMFKDPYDENALSDEEVIRLTHEYANEHGLDVINKNGEYYLGKGTRIPIKTNVDWGNTIFHIDESAGSGKHFIIEPSEPSFEPEFSSAEKQLIINGLKKGNNSIPALADYKNHFMIFNDSNKIVAQRFLAGSPSNIWTMEEYVYIGEGGIIEGNIYNDFDDITSIEAKFAENNYLTISGGTFILNGVGNPDISDAYNSGGIGINRCRVIIDNQYVGVEEDRLTETDTASAGFYNYSKVYDLTFKNIRALPRKRNLITNRGTYGFEGSRVINLTFENVQANGDESYWGVTGNNLIKNLIVRESKLNRIDVHFEARKVSLFDSIINQIELHGGDTLLIDNVEGYGNTFVNFRQDYGGSWYGDIIINNGKLNVSDDLDSRILRFDKGVNFNFPQERFTGLNIDINNFSFDFGNKNILRNIDLFAYNGVTTLSYNGTYLFNNFTAKNVRVVNNENELTGLNLLRLFRPYNLKTLKSGKYESYENYNRITPNIYLSFEDIDISKDLSTPQAINKPSIFIQTMDQSHLDLYDDYSPYPHITINKCRSLDLQLKASPAHVNVYDSEIVLLDGLEGGHSNCILHAVNTEMNPTFNGNTDEDGFYLPKHSTFTNCSLNPLIINGDVDIDRSITKNGLVTFELDKSRVYSIAHKLDISVSPLIRDRITEIMNKSNISFADGLVIACRSISQFKKYGYLTSGSEEDLPDMQNYHYNYGSTFYTTDTGRQYVFGFNGWKRVQFID